jgi:ribA/ribD-fused uncharacterized protein
MNTIARFAGPHAFLSNFYPAVVYLDGHSYRTVEHAFQAAKTDNHIARATIRAAATPGIAKRLGRRVTLAEDWSSRRLYVMQGLLEQKFARDPLRQQLLDTGTDELVEGNTWHDTYWGVCNGRGENHLGRLLMHIRAYQDTRTS